MKTYIENIINNITLKDIIYLLVIVFVLVLFIGKCKSIQNEYETNMIALTDSIHYYKSKSGNLVATKTAFTSDNIKNIKQHVRPIYDDIKDMNLKPGHITNAVHAEGEIKTPEADTVYVIKENDYHNNFCKEFNFNDNWRTLEGNIYYIRNHNEDSVKVNINKNIVKFDYTIAMDKQNKIYITSKNPYIKFNSLSGFQVPKQRQKRWNIGPQVGIGYDGQIRPYIGIGVTYGIINF